MKRIISSLVLSVALLGTVVAHEAPKTTVQNNKFVTWIKANPKKAAAIAAATVVVVGGGITLYATRNTETVKKCCETIKSKFTSTKAPVVVTEPVVTAEQVVPTEQVAAPVQEATATL